jgi:hypothetical protein
MSWVENRKSVKTRSAETYARRAWTLRGMPEASRPAFLVELNPSMRSDYATAWKLYRGWRRSKKDNVPPICLPAVTRCPYPREIMKAIFTVLQTASGLGAHRLAGLRWSEVRRAGHAGRWTIYADGTSYDASAKHLQVLEAWGRPEGLHAPVVPEQPGLLTPVSAYALTTWVYQYRKNRSSPRAQRGAKRP